MTSIDVIRVSDKFPNIVLCGLMDHIRCKRAQAWSDQGGQIFTFRHFLHYRLSQIHNFVESWQKTVCCTDLSEHLISHSEWNILVTSLLSQMRCRSTGKYIGSHSVWSSGLNLLLHGIFFFGVGLWGRRKEQPPINPTIHRYSCPWSLFSSYHLWSG